MAEIKKTLEIKKQELLDIISKKFNVNAVDILNLSSSDPVRISLTPETLA